MLEIKRWLSLLPMFSLFYSVTVYASNGDQMLGVNAVQWGMGGAVIAAPHGAGTVFSNPAGMASLDIEELRFDIGLGLMNPVRDVNDAKSETNLYLVPSGAVVFESDDDLTFGVGMGGISGAGVNFSDVSPAAGQQAVVTNKQFFKISPAIAYRINDVFDLGFALHINWQSVALYNSMFQLPQNTSFGFGYALGLNYHIDNAWKLGMVYISKQSIQKHEWNTNTGRFSMKIDGPQQIAVGLAYTKGNGALYELDIRRIAFSNVLGNQILNTPVGPQVLPFDWEDQTIIAFGTQHKINDKLTIRGGLNYGKSPIGSEDVVMNIGSLAITDWHVSLGFTRKMSQHLYSSLSFTHAPENRVRSNSSPTEIGLSQNVVYLQLSYR